MISSNMWVAIGEIVVGVLMLIGLAIWLKKKSKNNPKLSSKDNLNELLETSKKLSEKTDGDSLKAKS